MCDTAHALPHSWWDLETCRNPGTKRRASGQQGLGLCTCLSQIFLLKDLSCLLSAWTPKSGSFSLRQDPYLPSSPPSFGWQPPPCCTSSLGWCCPLGHPQPGHQER